MTSTALVLLPVAVAECTAFGVEQAFKCSVGCELSNINLIVECHIDAGIIESIDRTANLVVACWEVFLLPLPEDTIKVAVMEIEKRIYVISNFSFMPTVSYHLPPGLRAWLPNVPSTPPTPK